MRSTLEDKKKHYNNIVSKKKTDFMKDEVSFYIQRLNTEFTFDCYEVSATYLEGNLGPTIHQTTERRERDGFTKVEFYPRVR